MARSRYPSVLPCKQTTVQILYFSDEGVHCARKFDNLISLLVELVYSRTLPLFQQLMGHAAEPWLFRCSPVRISQKSLQAELAKQKTNFIGKNSSHKRCKYYCAGYFRTSANLKARFPYDRYDR